MEIVKWDKFGLGLGVILLIVAAALLVFWKDIDSVIITTLMVAGLISFTTDFSDISDTERSLKRMRKQGS